MSQQNIQKRNMQKVMLPIQGMHCRSCEILLEDTISKVPGVTKVSVHHKKGNAEVYYETKQPDSAALEQAVRDAGYSVGVASKQSFFSKNPSDYLELLFAGAALAALYLVLAGIGIFDTNIEFGSSPSMLVVILIGLVAGVSTCMALVGGLVLGISARHAELHPEATIAQKFRPHLFFNLGRIISYAVLGGVIGLAGSFLQLSSNITGLLVAAAGVMMFFIGIRLIEIIPGLSRVAFLLPKSISQKLLRNHETKEYSHTGALLTGAATFFLP
jgi:copper chaperone CopZ